MQRKNIIKNIEEILSSDSITEQNKIDIIEIVNDTFDYFENEVYLKLVDENAAVNERLKKVTEQFSKLEKMLEKY
jgi:hypothetical protein